MPVSLPRVRPRKVPDDAQGLSVIAVDREGLASVDPVGLSDHDSP